MHPCSRFAGCGALTARVDLAVPSVEEWNKVVDGAHSVVNGTVER